MRTTVTLDPDVKALIDRAMRERDISFKQALNDAVRVGLSQAARPAPEPYRIKSKNMGLPKVDLTKALAFAAELEDEEIIRKMKLGK